MCKLFHFPLNQHKKKEGKADIQFYKQLSAGSVTPPHDLCCLLPFYEECLEMTCSEIFWEIYEEQVPWKSYLIILVCLFSLNQSNSSNKPRMSLQHRS